MAMRREGVKKIRSLGFGLPSRDFVERLRGIQTSIWRRWGEKRNSRGKAYIVQKKNEGKGLERRWVAHLQREETPSEKNCVKKGGKPD